MKNTTVQQACSTTQWQPTLQMNSLHGPSSSFILAALKHAVGIVALTLCLLSVLLLLSGFRMDPASEHFPTTCGFCKVILKNPYSFGEHQKIHKNVKNFSFSCVACAERFTSSGAFNVHFTRCHREKCKDSTPSTSANLGVISAATYRTFGDVLLASSFTCNLPTCGEDQRTGSGLRKHMADHIKKGYIIQCPFGECPGKPMDKILNFTRVTTFRTHMCQYHSEGKERPLLRADCVEGVTYSDDEDSDDEDSDDLDSDDDGAASVCTSDCGNNAHLQQDGPQVEENIYPENMVRDYVGKFYLWLEGELLISSTKVQSISQELTTLCELSHHRLKSAMQEELVKAGLSKEKTDEVIEKVLKKDTVYAVHHKGADVVDMTTKHMREKFYKHRCVMLEAEEISLGRDDSGKQKYAHYISPKDTLLRMFADDSVQTQIEDSFQRKSKPDIYQDFSDGSVIKDHPIYKNVKCIQLILFQDAYEFFPLSPVAGTYKCVGFYFVLGNMDPNSRSQVDVIQLIEIVKEKDLKYFGIEYCLKKLLDELKVLAETGIMFKGEVLPVIVTHMCGDNLGQNFIGRYVECFNTDYYCRFCEITRAEIKREPSKTNPLRTPKDYDKTVSELDPTKQHIRKGIKGDSVLNKIPFFHVCNPGQPLCIAHDILEGIAKKDYALYLRYFLEVKGWVDFDTVNKKIKNFKCFGRDAADSLAPLDTGLRKIRGHASEVWMFIRMLPFLIGEYIQDEDDQVWQLCLKLKLICEYVFAPQISKKQVVKLKELIDSYVSIRSALFSKDVLPKHHLLCHYPELITYFGPLIRLWTLRFESRHMFFKNAAKSANNFINITKTLVNKYVLNFAYKFSGSLLSPPISFRHKDAYTIVMDDMIPDVQELLRQDLTFNQILQYVSVHGTVYTPGLWVLLGSERKNLMVGEIVLILYNGSELKLIVKVQQTANSFKGYYWILEDYDYASVQLDKLEDFYPLSAYQYQGHRCLTLKHSSPFMDQ